MKKVKIADEIGLAISTVIAAGTALAESIPNAYAKYTFNKTLKTIAVSTALYIAGAVSFVTPLHATIINPHAYAISRINKTNQGAFFSSTLGQEDLIPNRTADPNGFIDKEVWVNFKLGTSTVPQEVVVGKLPSNVRLISAQLKVYKDYLNQEHDKDIFTEVSPDRIVWVVKKSYPDGLDTRGGFFINAVRTEVFDAQTGEFISATTTGDGKKKTGSHV